MKQYLKEFNRAMQKVSIHEVEKAISIIHATQNNKGRIYIIGNGGSASLASHFANDLNKTTGKRFRAMCLSDNVPLLTAWANDKGYKHVFSEQLRNFVRPIDTLIAITCSGNSPNIIEAVELAKKKDLNIIAFTGFDGGKVRKLADVKIHVPSIDYGIIEPIHDAIAHYITNMLK